MENFRIVRTGALETRKVKWGKPEDVITVENDGNYSPQKIYKKSTLPTV